MGDEKNLGDDEGLRPSRAEAGGGGGSGFGVGVVILLSSQVRSKTHTLFIHSQRRFNRRAK